jgi:Leucine Rich repeat
MTRMDKPTATFRHFRFGLRTLLVVMTLLCIWLAIEVNAVRRQKEAVEAILATGGSVWYDYQATPSTSLTKLLASPQSVRMIDLLGMPSKFDFNQNAVLSVPAWLRNQFGSGYFCTVISVKCSQRASATAKAKEQIDQLAKLPALKEFIFLGGYPSPPVLDPQDVDFTALQQLNNLGALTIYNFRVDGPVLARFRSIGRLTHLSLSNTGFDDVAMEQVGRMINLDQLWLHHTLVTDIGFAQVEKLTKLQFLSLSEAQITDAAVMHLARLNGLKYLSLRHTQVTDKGVLELQKALPNCQIAVY